MAKRSTAVRSNEEASHEASATAVNKKIFIAALAAGMAPGVAAETIQIGRSTAYNWKTADKEFSAAWEEAVETALDRLETELYDIAKNDPDNISPRIKAIDITLRNRRYGSAVRWVRCSKTISF